jgi:hypothetical protein
VVRIAIAAMVVFAGVWARGAFARPAAPSVARVVVPARVTTSVIQAMTSTLQDIQHGYASSNWGQVSRAFVSADVGREYTGDLRQWKNDAGGALHVELVSTTPLGGNRYVGTVRFAGDPRTVPTYGVFIFGSGPGGMRIVGLATGLHGTTFRNTNWAISRTAHFIVYHSPFQLLGSDRQGLVDLESQRRAFARKFGLTLPPRIDYYLYPNQRLIARLTDGTCGSNPDNVGCTLQFEVPPTIHASEWVSFHEPIHAYQTVMEPKGYTAPLFISEGMAVALEDRNVDPRQSDYCSEVAYVPLDECAQYAVMSVRPIDLLSDAGFNHADAGYAYSLGGSFVKYLILHYGDRPFAKFYYALAAQPKDRVQDYDVAAHRVFHTGIQALLHSWQVALCRTGCG